MPNLYTCAVCDAMFGNEARFCEHVTVHIKELLDRPTQSGMGEDNV